MPIDLTLEQIIAIVKPLKTRGATTARVQDIAALSAAIVGDLSFLGNLKYKNEVSSTRASVVLLPADFEHDPQPNQLFLLVENPSLALAKICVRLEQLLWPKPTPGIHHSAFVASDAVIAPTATVGPLCVVESGATVGERVHLQAHVFVGRGAEIGADCWLMPGGVVAAECVLKQRVRLQPGVVIGSDGFGYEFSNGRHAKVPQVGNVVVEDDVEIGANSTLDRARFSRTVIGAGTKIDNLVQIAHNVTIGQHCMICAQVGISGSSVIEDFVVIGGQAGLAGHLTVGRGSKIDGQTGVNTDLAPGSFVKGSPCLPYQLEQRVNVLRRRLPDLFKRVDLLEAKLDIAK